jgi:D-alanine-D-alanine ligase-like ATP-grasp enzyme
MNKIQIINSKDHWTAGWFSKPEMIQYVIDNVLNKAELEVDIEEVSSISELEKLLDSLSPNTLVWTNAYYVDTENGGTEWLNQLVEERNLSLFGSDAKTLQILLEKDICQTILNKNNIPIPDFAILSSEDANNVEQFLYLCNIDYPIVLKPTAACFSQGVCLVKNHAEAVENAQQILIDFPKNNLIVEEFLPNDDITCGYLELGEDILLMPTHYSYQNKPGKDNIYSFEDRLIGLNKKRGVVTEQLILNQLEIMIPRIVEIFNIRDITRIDGRLDKKGTLRYFDINGFPGLGFNGFISDIVEQCFVFFPNYSQVIVYQALINTVMANALMRNNLHIPEILNTHNLFTLESDLVVRTKKMCLDNA